MRAIRLYSPGGIEDLRLEEIEAPRSRPGQVLVRVHAAAITRGELEWPIDRLPAIPSYELSGVVVEDNDGFVAGDDVIALMPFDRDGAATEYALVPAEALGPKPASLSYIEAAALPMPGLSAWQALIVHGQLQPGERVGVTGANGGVGHLAVQLARSRGAEVVAAAGRVVTVVEETPGAQYFVVEPNREQLIEVAGLADRGDVRPEIDSIFSLANARAAFSRSAAHGKHGKVVLRVSE
jgi:NADPH:quinone reductase-like Zn-dependent oxidoreductase